MSAIKNIDIKEFRELGFLQEVNRLFFHPRGLALAININDATGDESLHCIWDYRDDPEGVIFANWDDLSNAKAKADRVATELQRHTHARKKLFGDFIQEIGQEPKE